MFTLSAFDNLNGVHTSTHLLLRIMQLTMSKMKNPIKHIKRPLKNKHYIKYNHTL